MTTAAPHAPWTDAARRLLRNRAAVAGGAIVAAMVALAALYTPISMFVTRFTLAESTSGSTPR
jgi:hypothetical protein